MANWEFDNTGIIECLRGKLVNNFDSVKLKSDTINTKNNDNYITSNWKFRLTKDTKKYKGYIGFRNKHTRDEDGDFEFTELSSFTLQPKTNYKTNYYKRHVNDVGDVATKKNSANADEVLEAIDQVADAILSELTTHKELYEY